MGTGECTIGIGFLHDAIYQIVDNGYGNIGMVVPSSGASFEVGATAIFKGAKMCIRDRPWTEPATCVSGPYPLPGPRRLA